MNQNNHKYMPQSFRLRKKPIIEDFFHMTYGALSYAYINNNNRFSWTQMHCI